MKNVLWLSVLGLVFLSLFNGAFASFPDVYTIDGYYGEMNYVKARSDSGSWGTNITAETGDYVDVEATATLRYYWGYYPYPDDYIYPATDLLNITIEVKGYKNGYWSHVAGPLTQSAYTYANHSQTFSWNNAFTVSGDFERYEVTAYAAVSGYPYDSERSAWVEVEMPGAGCEDIRIDGRSVYLGEGETSHETFTIRNNSDTRFYIDGFNAYDSSPHVSVSDYDYDQTIGPNRTGELGVKIIAAEVSGDKTATGNLNVSGHFEGGKYCNSSEIGTETFTVYVKDTAPDAYCSDISISANDVEMEENSVKYANVRVYNRSGRGFYLTGLTAGDNSTFLDAEVSGFSDAYIGANSSKLFQVRLDSGSLSGEKQATVTVRGKGYFASGGGSCSLGSIVGYFVVTVGESQEAGVCPDIRIRTHSISMNENEVRTVEFGIDNLSGQRFIVQSARANDLSSYLEVDKASNSTIIYGNDEGYIKARIESENVSSDKLSQRAYAELSGYFRDSRGYMGESCSFTQTRKYFEVDILDRDNAGSGYGYCGDVDVITETVYLDSGETKYPTFTVKNRGSRDFYLDNVRVFDNSQEIRAEEYMKSSRINANSPGYITAKITAFHTNRDETATAYIDFSGRFSDGTHCSSFETGKESFTVRVNADGKDEGFCPDFELDVPGEVTVDGDGGFRIEVNNSGTEKTGEIRLRGTNAGVSPSIISIRAGQHTTERVSVEVEGRPAYVTFDVDLSGCNISSQSTKIISAPSDERELRIVSAPDRETLTGKEALGITVKNDSGEDLDVMVSFKGFPGSWEIEEKTVFIEARESKTVYLEVSPKESGTFSGMAVAEADSFRDTENFQLVVDLGDGEIGLSAEVTPPLTGNTYTLEVTVKNDSNERIEGILELNVPEEWESEGEMDVSVGAGDEKTYALKVTPNERLTEAFEAKATLVTDSGLEYSEGIEFGVPVPAIGTAFAALISNPFNLVLVIIIIILLIVLLKRK